MSFFKLPYGCKASAKVVSFDGLIRPKVFIKIILVDEINDMIMVRYVRARSKWLRLRLFISMVGMKGSLRKFRKFKSNWKVA